MQTDPQGTAGAWAARHLLRLKHSHPDRPEASGLFTSTQNPRSSPNTAVEKLSLRLLAHGAVALRRAPAFGRFMGTLIGRQTPCRPSPSPVLSHPRAPASPTSLSPPSVLNCYFLHFSFSLPPLSASFFPLLLSFPPRCGFHQQPLPITSAPCALSSCSISASFLLLPEPSILSSEARTCSFDSAVRILV